MIVLRVKEKGHLLNIPGMKAVRSPVEIDISKHKVELIIINLKRHGIKNYEIVKVDDSPVKKIKKDKEVYVEDKYKGDINNRFNKLEKMIHDVLQNKGNIDQNREQITNKLEVLEGLTRSLLKKQKDEMLKEKILKEEPEIEELEKTFIPEIDTKGMILKGDFVKTTVQQDKVDQDDIDLLSKLLGKKV